MAYPKVILVHFGELWLRGKNRPSYIAVLRHNIIRQLNGERFKLYYKYDRFLIEPDADEDLEKIVGKLSHVFGISRIAVAEGAAPELGAIVSAASKAIEALSAGDAKRLRIVSHRSYKNLPFDSNDIVKSLSEVARSSGLIPVNKGYDTTLFVNVTKESAYIYDNNLAGQRGLPVGSSGKCIVLFSGGIDSPVAAWFAMKRGLIPVYLHVHPSLKQEGLKETKIHRLTEMLSEYYPGYKAYYIPAHIFQAAATKAEKRYEGVLFKAFLFRLAEKIAKKEGAKIMVTGESIGQVASQTIDNIAASQYGIKMPVVMPLSGFDKEEIISVARTIGTYEESIKPYRDVCAMGANKPATTTGIDRMKKMLKDISMGDVVRRSMKLAYVVEKEA